MAGDKTAVERRRSRRQESQPAAEQVATVSDAALRPVARTMAERGIVCTFCAHPFGRHDVEHGCVALLPADDDPLKSQVLARCGCSAAPG